MEPKQYVIKNKATGKYFRSAKSRPIRNQIGPWVIEEVFNWSDIHGARVFSGIGPAKSSLVQLLDLYGRGSEAIPEEIEFIPVEIREAAGQTSD